MATNIHEDEGEGDDDEDEVGNDNDDDDVERPASRKMMVTVMNNSRLS